MAQQRRRLSQMCMAHLFCLLASEHFWAQRQYLADSGEVLARAQLYRQCSLQLSDKDITGGEYILLLKVDRARAIWCQHPNS
jgi:hypothetical protein